MFLPNNVEYRMKNRASYLDAKVLAVAKIVSVHYGVTEVS